jgi:hypothetical protein
MRVWIAALGEVVFDSDDGGNIRRPGKWQRTLAAIVAQFEDRYGKVPAPLLKSLQPHGGASVH